LVDSTYDGDSVKVTFTLLLFWPITLSLAFLWALAWGVKHTAINIKPIGRGLGKAAIYPASCVKEVARFAVKAGQK